MNKEKKIKLIFTVDCGTLSFEAIDFAKKNNIDVIVLDHHQSEVKLPKAFSIINPNRFDDNSDLKYLCAAGVAFIFLVLLWVINGGILSFICLLLSAISFSLAYKQSIPLDVRFFPISAIAGISGSLVVLLGELL